MKYRNPRPTKPMVKSASSRIFDSFQLREAYSLNSRAGSKVGKAAGDIARAVSCAQGVSGIVRASAISKETRPVRLQRPTTSACNPPSGVLLCECLLLDRVELGLVDRS